MEGNILYVPDLIVKNRLMPAGYFGTAAIEKNSVTIPGKRTIESSLNQMKKGEVFIPKMPSLKIVDLAKSLSPSSKHIFIGMRPGEKLHELLSSLDESQNMIEFKDYFVITPSIFKNNLDLKKGKKVKRDFFYSSNTNKDFLTINKISKFLDFK